jgi:hypothetical protein
VTYSVHPPFYFLNIIFRIHLSESHLLLKATPIFPIPRSYSIPHCISPKYASNTVIITYISLSEPVSGRIDPWSLHPAKIRVERELSYHIYVCVCVCVCVCVGLQASAASRASHFDTPRTRHRCRRHHGYNITSNDPAESTSVIAVKGASPHQGATLLRDRRHQRVSPPLAKVAVHIPGGFASTIPCSSS